ncbi:hypothetical protein CISIN_1g046073mg, partial [Citrus sinensis]
VKETFRLHPPIPLLLSRKASEDGEIIGFIVPKGARVLATSRDESTWDHAHSFMPIRFLGSDVDFIGRNFESIPFGVGRRICPDLPLDITMLYP